MSSDTPLAEAARAAVRRLQEDGRIAYWAGGCVRDRLLGREPKDYDIATDALPDRVLELFPGSVAVGKAFGVVRARYGPFEFETATFRRDHGYADGRRPDGVTFCDPRTDAERRDFSVNALFFDPVADQVHDFVGGRDDLRRRVIRCVGDPDARLREDALRLLRAARFTTTLDFTLDPPTEEAVRRNADALGRVSPERIRDELTRLLTEAGRPGGAVRLLASLNLLAVVLPEVAALRGQEQPPQFHPEGDVFEHTVLMLDALQARTPLLVWAVLLHDIGKPLTAVRAPDRLRFNRHAEEGADAAAALLRRLRFANADAADIVHCIRNHMRFMHVRAMRPARLRRLLGAPTFDAELELHRVDCLASHGDLDNYTFLREQRAAYAQRPALPAAWIRGEDVLALGVPPGPRVGAFLRDAYDAQLDGRFPDRAALLEWVRDRAGETL
jgi:putative nucleotidyltransferase with HDIG domain